MKVLAILQNQWFRDPERVAMVFTRFPTERRALIHRFLFGSGCRTGKVLKAVFGQRINDIVWEESSRNIGGLPASTFPPDPVHLQEVLVDVQPDVVMAFGNIAIAGVGPLVQANKLIIGPHPTARRLDTLPKLREMAVRLTEFEARELK